MLSEVEPLPEQQETNGFFLGFESDVSRSHPDQERGAAFSGRNHLLQASRARALLQQAAAEWDMTRCWRKKQGSRLKRGCALSPAQPAQWTSTALAGSGKSICNLS
jgi:hypothetical protein